MNFTLKEARSVLKALSNEEIELFETFLQNHPVLASSMQQFAMVKGTKEPIVEGQEMKWFDHLEANMAVAKTCLQDFMYGPGTLRILNFWMMQFLGTDRKISPGITARVMPVALNLAQVQSCDLHTVWFGTRLAEWQGNRDLKKLAETPILLLDHEKKPKPVDEEPSPLINTIEAIESQRHQMVASAIERIAQRVAEAQAQDFDLHAEAIGWWEIAEDADRTEMSYPYYFPTIEAIEVLAQLDPVERRQVNDSLNAAKGHVDSLAKHVAKKMEELSRLLIKASKGALPEDTLPPSQPQQVEPIQAQPQQPDLQAFAEELVADVGKLNTTLNVYWLMRVFHNDEPSATVFWHICMLESFLRRGLTEIASKTWEGCKHAFDFHLSPILGLWLLDLRRELIHIQGNSETFGADFAWLHALESKYVKALQTGNYSSES